MYKDLCEEELERLSAELKAEHDEILAEKIVLNISRGQPCTQQLDLSLEMEKVLNKHEDFYSKTGFDVRNYGLTEGVLEARELFAELLDVEVKNVMVGGSASLAMMHDFINRSFVFGVLDNTPFSKQGVIKFICPVPGYDRHFDILESYGFEMITVPMLSDGPDMDMVENLLENDDRIKGIWCVPKYSNPTGVVYSDEVVRRFAKLKPRAKDFRIYWDNAYAIHDLYEEAKILSILRECEKAGNPDLCYMFTSTSKITYPESGVSAIAASLNNIKDIRKGVLRQRLNFNKVNQMRHAKYFGNLDGMRAHMKKHADIVRPKVELVLAKLEKNFGSAKNISWTKPRGGYFISVSLPEGTAKRTYQICAESGLTLTPVANPFPHLNDPKDSNIRIAPTYPDIALLEKALNLFCTAAKIASVEKALADK